MQVNVDFWSNWLNCQAVAIGRGYHHKKKKLMETESVWKGWFSWASWHGWDCCLYAKRFLDDLAWAAFFFDEHPNLQLHFFPAAAPCSFLSKHPNKSTFSTSRVVKWSIVKHLCQKKMQIFLVRVINFEKACFIAANKDSTIGQSSLHEVSSGRLSALR